jgi:CHAT domain-containing protein
MPFEISLEKLGDRFFFRNNFDSALYYYQTILHQPKPQSTIKARSLIKIGSIYFSLNKIDSAIQNLKAGLNTYNRIGKSLSKNDYEYIYSGTVLIANCLRLSGKYQLALNNLEDIELIITRNDLKYNVKKRHELLSEIFSWKALVFFDFGLINKSITYNIKAIDIIEKYGYSDCLIYNNYSDLGRIFMNEGDLLKSEQYYNQAIRIVKNCFGSDSFQYAELMSEIGLLYLELKKFDDAIYHFNIAHDISQYNHANSEIDLAYTFNNLGDAFCGLNQFKKAISYYLQAKDLFLKNKYFQRASVVYHNLGIANFALDSIEKAKDYYYTSLNLMHNKNLPSSIYTSYTHQRLGQLFNTQNKYLKAIFHFNQAISIIQQNPLDTTAINKQLVKSNTLSKYELLKSLYHKGYSEFQYYTESKNKQYLLNSINSFQKAILVSDILRQYYNFFNAKLSLNETYIPLLNNYIEALFTLKKTNPSINYDNNILNAIGRSQYIVLRSLIKSTNFKTYFSVSPHIQAVLDTLIREIILHEERVYNLNNGFNSKKNNSAAEKQLFKTTFSLDTFLYSLNEKFPGFQNQMCKFSVHELLQIQSLLPDSACIVQYYIYSDNLVIIAINNKNHIISNFKCDRIQIDQQKDKLLQSIIFSNKKSFKLASNYFYDLLLGPVESLMLDCNKLIIIPDLAFTGIPFEVFSKNNDYHSSPADNNNYLISKYQVSYQYSLNLWYDKVNASKTISPCWKYEFAGFAPKFSGSSIVQGLSHSSVEVKNISKIFERLGKGFVLYYDSCVTENIILEEFSKSKIIHIASHGIQSNNNNEYYISFNKNDNIPNQSSTIIEDGKLRSTEIFTTPINSELVTLSVCSSGSGQEVIGEGKFSFVYSLYFAGAGNILYTLWDVSDFHSQVFMFTFYQYVNSGLDYTTALQKTKQEFINSKYSLPVFWSGYIINN